MAPALLAASVLLAPDVAAAQTPATSPATPPDKQEGVMVYGRRVPFHDPRFKPAPTQPPPVEPDAEMRASHDAVTGAQLGAFGDAYQTSGPLTQLNPANRDPSMPGTGGR